MINDSEALDAMHETIKRWNVEGGSISTEELIALAGDDYTVHNDKRDKLNRRGKLTHKFGRVVETGGHFWVAVGLHDRWLMDDTNGRIIAERYKILKQANKDKNSKLNTPEMRIYTRVSAFNRLHPDRIVETPLEARERYIAEGYVPDYIKNNDIPRK